MPLLLGVDQLGNVNVGWHFVVGLQPGDLRYGTPPTLPSPERS
jgi:hypothetical protein